MMDDKRLAADEYERQYYDFSSTELCEDFEEQVREAIKAALIEMDTALKEQNCDEESREQKIGKIYALYVEKAKVPLAKFKEEAKKIFAIPDNVILDEDKYNTIQPSDEDIVQLKKEVAELENELLREKVFLAKCKQQKEIIDAIKPLYEKTDDLIKFLKKLPENTEAKTSNKNKKMYDMYDKYIQHYFDNEEAGTTNWKILEAENSFPKKTEHFFDSHK